MRDAVGSVQSVLLLGGTSEIGLAAVRALVGDRARTVVLAARDEDRAEAAAGELRAVGANVGVVRFDAERDETLAPALDAAFGRPDGETRDVDVAIVAFGRLGAGPEHQTVDAPELQRVNAVGAVAAMAALAERMRAQGHGTIVLLSSAAADRPRVANYAYGASKAAADAFARGLGDALHGSGVEVLVVRPGFVRTRMTRHLRPAPLAVDADAVAAAIVAGMRARARVVYVPAALRWVMLAVRLLPRPLMRRLPR